MELVFGPDDFLCRSTAVTGANPSHSSPPVPDGALPAFGSMLVIIFLAAMDATVVATALPAIAADLNGSSSIGLVVAGFLLGTAVSIPVWGKLADLRSMRSLYLAAALMFVVSSGLIGLAPSMWVFIAARVVQGVGTGGLMALTPTIVGVLFPASIRGKYQGIQGAVLASSSVIGPLVGGIFVDTIGWRWAFLINVPLGAVGLAVVAKRLRLPDRALSRRPLDIGGAFILAVSVVALLLAFGEIEFVSSTAATRFLASIGFGAAAGYYFWQRRSNDPIVPLRLLSNRVVAAGVILGATSGLISLVVTIHIPIYAQIVEGQDATAAAIVLLPLSFGVITYSIAGGQIVSRMQQTKPVLAGGSILTAIGTLAIGQDSVLNSSLATAVALVLVGTGTGLVMQPALLAVQNAAEPTDLGAATASTAFFRQITGTIAIGVLGGLLASRAASELERIERGGALSDVERSVVGDAVTANLTVALAVAIVAAVVAFAMPSDKLESSLDSAMTPAREPT